MFREAPESYMAWIVPKWSVLMPSLMAVDVGEMLALLSDSVMVVDRFLSVVVEVGAESTLVGDVWACTVNTCPREAETATFGGRVVTRSVHRTLFLLLSSVRRLGDQNLRIRRERLDRIGGGAGSLGHEVVDPEARPERFIDASANGLEDVDSLRTAHVLIQLVDALALVARLQAVDEEREELAFGRLDDLVQVLVACGRLPTESRDKYSAM